MQRGTKGSFALDKDDFAVYINSYGSIEKITNNFDKRAKLNTAANIFSNFEHEFRGHGEKIDLKIPVGRTSDSYAFYEHKAIYRMQMESPNFEYTSGEYREHIIDKNSYYDSYEGDENEGGRQGKRDREDEGEIEVSRSPRFN